MPSDDIAISVKNLTKKYRIFGHPGDRIKQALTLGRMRFHREFTALQDVSFEIKKGETVGIIGRNGSGKSTLLQLICGILKPTSGSVQVKGRVSALLELGAGFNPEFTGRENVYFQGAVMGFRREDMEARFNEIASFADIGEFIDQPVRTYSSGMFVRLAFAVAINVEPDILVIDEALSVGDEAFQRKCFSRIHRIHEQGGTILFVSHSIASIAELCDQVMLLSHGEVALFDEPKKVVSLYYKLISAAPDIHGEIMAGIKSARLDEKSMNAIGTSQHSFFEEAKNAVGKSYFDESLISQSVLSYEQVGANILNPSLCTLSGEKVNVLIGGNDYLLVYDVFFSQEAFAVRSGAMLKTKSGFELGGFLSAIPGKGIAHAPKGTSVRMIFQFHCVLQEGVYFINCGVVGHVNGVEEFLHRIVDAVAFRVQPQYDKVGTGIVDFTPLSFTCSEIKQGIR